MTGDPGPIPDFLNKLKPGATMTTAPQTPAAKTPRKTRQNALITRMTISIPLDMADPESFGKASTAIAKIKDNLPAGSTVETVSATLGKM